ncbi:MAG TPA: hypothetical protein DCQ06_00885 [Myxococcales bacterium]|nr:hypothetical protein [Myxococcales bacterium]HAN30127.1 hypothetical protein [Myxococcales bacterium]
MRQFKSTGYIAFVLAIMVGCSSTDDSGASSNGGSDSAAAVDAAEDTTSSQDSASATDSASGQDVAVDAGGAADSMVGDSAVASDATEADSAEADSTDPDAGGAADTTSVDTTPKKVCTAGETKCAGSKLATCGVFEDGYIETNCFPGTTCSEGQCKPVSNNLMIVFDTSGSMNATVSGCKASGQVWPSCDPTKKCTRMDVSKQVFSSALAKIDDKVTRMAMFRFPQRLYKKTSATCMSGFYGGLSSLSGETSPGPKDQQFVNDSSSWYWLSLKETLCVPFPSNGMAKTKTDMMKWMNGTEAIQAVGGACSNSSSLCKPVAGCDGWCCSGQCWKHVDPELRQTGGTPIGKTLFYVGEYLKNKVVIDGKKCKTTTDCDNVNYSCKKANPTDVEGQCKDEARTCRETVVVLFTDGGESNSTKFFAPWVQAKRLGHGLCCQTDADCVGGTVENPTVCKGGQCLPKLTITGYYCSEDMAPCLPSAQLGEAAHCKKNCIKDPMPNIKTCAANPQHNVLRSPDGKPFGVKLSVVDISGASNLSGSMSISIAGNGSLLGADASDPVKFLQTLNAVFDIKNKKVCNDTF